MPCLRAHLARVPPPRVFRFSSQRAHARWLEHGSSEAAGQLARRSTGADLAALLDAAEHVAPSGTASRFRSPAVPAHLDSELELAGGTPDPQARALHGLQASGWFLACSASGTSPAGCGGAADRLVHSRAGVLALHLVRAAETEPVQLRRRSPLTWPR